MWTLPLVLQWGGSAWISAVCLLLSAGELRSTAGLSKLLVNQQQKQQRSCEQLGAAECESAASVSVQNRQASLNLGLLPRSQCSFQKWRGQKLFNGCAVPMMGPKQLQTSASTPCHSALHTSIPGQSLLLLTKTVGSYDRDTDFLSASFCRAQLSWGHLSFPISVLKRS